MAIDAVIAVALLGGLVGADIVSKQTNADMSPIVAGLIVGLLGPLALRSPVRHSKVKGQDSQVGITYIYDAVRLYSLYALDERIVRLVRTDVSKLRVSWIDAGITAEMVVDELNSHVAEHDRLPSDARTRIRKETGSAITLPSEEGKLEALIKIMRKERLNGLIDYFRSAAEKASLAGSRPSDVAWRSPSRMEVVEVDDSLE